MIIANAKANSRMNYPHDDADPEARYCLLEQAIERAKQERGVLNEELKAIYDQTCAVSNDKDTVSLNRDVELLTECVRHFIRDWSEYKSWEDAELFPHAALYLGVESDSFELMEREYELGERLLEACGHHLDGSLRVAATPENVRAVTSSLLQAYAFLKNRFREEEEMMEALEDQTDRSNKFGF
ncbi:hypothetical protein D7Z26_14600 [Cohnella endophytica]|uniref:Uncharacterized protein n=1 Tax=Cohnella endophytica TaxID=2419778 RepID=A0A494XTJ0_9BACL|nr:hypothetical protein [Cohnella endophytica]RKP52971.1 hypothetical protein D7Z26_14600 [Cohnella endophytica]